MTNAPLLLDRECRNPLIEIDASRFQQGLDYPDTSVKWGPTKIFVNLKDRDNRIANHMP